jgi:hypothetical protein
MVYGSDPDNPLFENSIEWKGRGWASLDGAGVNAAVPQKVNITLPDLLVSTAVEQAYLYVNLIYGGESDDLLANATVSLNTVSLGTSPPYSWDFVNSVWGDFWNIYRWNVTDIVDATGGGIYTVDIDSDVSAKVGNVLLAVIYSDPSVSPKHIIINDGIEALISSNQTTIFNDVGPSWHGGYLDIAVTGGEYDGSIQLDEKYFLYLDGGFGYVAGNAWNSTEGPYLDLEGIHGFGISPPRPTGDVNLTLGTGTDDIGWEVSILQAELRDVYAENQTHPNSEVLQGIVEPVDVAVGNSNDDWFPYDEEDFNVTLYVDGPVTGSIGTIEVNGLQGGTNTTLTFNWDTAGYPPGTYIIRAHADSDNTIPEFDEEDNWCNSTSTLRIMTPPVADADGPYSGYEGSSVILDGSGSYDLDGTIVSYEWDLDYDGSYDDAAGVSPQYTWCDDYNGLIGLNVTDDDGLYNTSATTATIKNVQPAITYFNVTYFDSWCDTVGVEFLAEFTDPGWCDTHTALWDWGDGSTSPGDLTEENVEPDSTGTVTGRHTYHDARSRDYTVMLCIFDDDGGVDCYEYRYVPGPVGGELIPSSISKITSTMIFMILVSSLIMGVKRRCTFKL